MHTGVYLLRVLQPGGKVLERRCRLVLERRRPALECRRGPALELDLFSQPLLRAGGCLGQLHEAL